MSWNPKISLFPTTHLGWMLLGALVVAYLVKKNASAITASNDPATGGVRG